MMYQNIRKHEDGSIRAGVCVSHADMPDPRLKPGEWAEICARPGSTNELDQHVIAHWKKMCGLTGSEP
ncbi:MAG: hypothetical protein R3D34_06915 [Nitratireductor sp.]